MKFIYHNHIYHKNIDTNKQCAKILRMSRLKAMTFIWYLGRIVQRRGNFSRVNVVDECLMGKMFIVLFKGNFMDGSIIHGGGGGCVGDVRDDIVRVRVLWSGSRCKITSF